jgi:hypothetical protein
MMQLIVQSGPDAGKNFDLSAPLTVAGRQVGSDILLNDSQVSRRHAQFENKGGSVFITDLGSANGSFVNGQRLAPSAPVLVKPGDSVKLGDTNMLAQASVSNNFTPPTQMAMPAAPQPPVQNYPEVGFGTGAAAPQYQQPPLQNYQPQGYQQPPVQNFQAQPPVQNFQPQPPYQPQGYQQPPKKGNGGLIIGLVIGAIVVIGGIVALVLALGSSDKKDPQNVTTTVAQIKATPLPTAPSTTAAVGSSGTNAPPPSPGPITTTAVRTTVAPASTTAASQGGQSNSVSKYGVAVTFPAGWTAKTGEQGNNIGSIQGVGPNGSFLIITRYSGLPGELIDRAESIIKVFQNQNPSLEVTSEPDSLGSNAVSFEIQYPNSSNTLIYEGVIVTQNSAKDTYIIEAGAAKDNFKASSSAFGDIISSIKIS